jgi:hypothetical protein
MVERLGFRISEFRSLELRAYDLDLELGSSGFGVFRIWD